MNKIEFEEIESIQKIRRITEDQINKLQRKTAYKSNSILPEVIGFVGLVVTYILLF